MSKPTPNEGPEAGPRGKANEVPCPECGGPCKRQGTKWDILGRQVQRYRSLHAEEMAVAVEWRQCKTHPDVDGKTMWGCPDCLVELRREVGAHAEKMGMMMKWQEPNEPRRDRFEVVTNILIFLLSLAVLVLIFT